MEYAWQRFPIYGKIFFDIKRHTFSPRGHLYFDSNNSVIFTSSPFAILSIVSMVGETAPISMRCSVDLLTPLVLASFSNVIFLSTLTFARRIFIPYPFLLTLLFIISIPNVRTNILYAYLIFFTTNIQKLILIFKRLTSHSYADIL